MALPLEQPYARVSIDGVPVPGLVECEVDAGGYLLAGRFMVAFAIGAAPGFGGTFFSGLTNQNILIEAGFGGIGYVPILTGRIDAVRVDWSRNISFIYGRDMAGVLIDTEIAQSFVNQTASQIAGTIAEEHGLIGNVTPTSALVGQYYQRDHARTALGLNANITTEWELLSTLAKEEGFQVSVAGNVLNFGVAKIGVPIVVTTQQLSTLVFDAVTALPGAVTVKSWNCRSKSMVSETYGAGLGTTIIRPNLMQSQAASLAQNHAQTLGKHQLVMQARMPADGSLAPGMRLVLSGTGVGFDQTYIVDAVTRRLNGRVGFVQDVRAHAMAMA